MANFGNKISALASKAGADGAQRRIKAGKKNFLHFFIIFSLNK